MNQQSEQLEPEVTETDLPALQQTKKVSVPYAAPGTPEREILDHIYLRPTYDKSEVAQMLLDELTEKGALVRKIEDLKTEVEALKIQLSAGNRAWKTVKSYAKWTAAIAALLALLYPAWLWILPAAGLAQWGMYIMATAVWLGIVAVVSPFLVPLAVIAVAWLLYVYRDSVKRFFEKKSQ